MYPSQHLFIGIVFSLILFFIFPTIGILGATIVALSSVLIDVDHYFYYLIKKNDFNLKNSYKWYNEKIKKIFTLPKEKRLEYYHGAYILHGFEVLFLLSLLSLISPYFLFILTGFNLHLFLDTISDYQNYTKSYKYSLFANLIYSKKLKSFD